MSGLRKALDERLIRVDPSDPEHEGLIGNHCPVCDLTFFPKREFCARCTRSLESEVLMGRKGKLVAFSKVHRAPPFAMIEAPYVLGEVDTGQGVKIVAVVKAPVEELSIGMDIDLVLEKFKEDDEGNDLIVYFGMPAGA